MTPAFVVPTVSIEEGVGESPVYVFHSVVLLEPLPVGTSVLPSFIASGGPGVIVEQACATTRGGIAALFLNRTVPSPPPHPPSPLLPSSTGLASVGNAP